MNKSQQNKFFLISFIPAVAYWYLEANYSLKVALIGGIGLAILELALEYILFKHTHKMSQINFGLIVFLGGLSLLGDEGIWFKLQPMFTGYIVGGFLLFKNVLGNSLMWEMIQEFNENPPPESLIATMEKHMSVLLICYGTFMGYVAWQMTTDQWLFFRTIGFYIVFAIFMIFELIYIRRKARQMYAKALGDQSSNNR